MTLHRNARSGFTLIELLVVVAIISLMSAVVIASLTTARQKSRDARRISDIRQVRLALEMYYDSKGSYPTTSGLQAFDATVATTTGIGVLSPGYIGKLPSDPVQGGLYFYCGMATSGASDCNSGSSAASFALGTNLELDHTVNKVLDADANRTIGTSFYGANPSCNSATTGIHKCYDVAP